MGIADPEGALERLREFLRLQHRADSYELGEVPRDLHEAIDRLEPHIKKIARALGEERVGDVAGLPFTAMAVTNRLIGTLERQEEFERILAPGPTLAANRLHPWVWEAAASLWDGGHYDSAVHAAYKAVERQTQVSIGRLDLDGKALFGQAFSVKEPKPGEQRLRFPDINSTEEPKRWTSAHEGAQNLGMGCAQGIRNPQAHPSPDLTEQEALEQLAALSVLARWVDACEPVPAQHE